MFYYLLLKEHEKILYFYPDGRTQDEQLSVIGLCHALLSFSSIFSTSCTSLHTRKGKRHFYQMSDNIWAVMVSFRQLFLILIYSNAALAVFYYQYY